MTSPLPAAGANTLAAKQIDAQGNESVFSNLWTLTAPSGNLLSNGDLSGGNTGFTNELINVSVDPVNSTALNQYRVGPLSGTSTAFQTNVAATSSSQAAAYPFGTWSKAFVGGSSASGTIGNPDGAITGNALIGQVSSSISATIWSSSVSVQAGVTYTFKVDYINFDIATTDMGLTIDGAYVQFVTNNFESGRLTLQYTAPSTKTINLAITGAHNGTAGNGDFVLDNFSFAPAVRTNDGTLIAVGTSPATPSADSLTYTGGLLSSLESNDTITVPTPNLSTLLGMGGMIDGGSGVDTLKLAAGTKLSLPDLTSTQTVVPLQEVEIIQMQGNSSLEINANNVLSLGGTNLAGYSFASTTGGSASTASTGKVQMVINGTNTDTIAMGGLVTDGLGSNTGTLAGRWEDKGSVTIGGVSYKVYDHSTTQAQLLVNVNVTPQINVVTFNSMTKDTGTTNNANWITSDVTAGRLVSGSVSGELEEGAVVKVFANGTLIGNAVTSGNQWAITDPNGYNSNWTYTAKVVLADGKEGNLASQSITVDTAADAAPVITGLTNSAGTAVANNATITSELRSVTGTGVAGSVVYVFDNNLANVIGSATVAAGGTWSVPITGAIAGANTFAARQVDANGNQSVLSNLWTATPQPSNLLVNGDFSQGLVGFTASSTPVVSVNSSANFDNYGVSAVALNSGAPAAVWR